MPNRLAKETSPYLLQHANNPVDWYPWGPEALAKSKAENKPIFLSIGYSACHWCHVMEHESFENEDIAKLINANYVPVKVDREERPDLDQIYMNAVQAMTGRGGWPMTVFLTPDLKPFYGGTYFPPKGRGGMPGFDQVLSAVNDAWANRRDDVMAEASKMTEYLKQAAKAEFEGGPLGLDLLTSVEAALERSFDHQYGGFGSAPKFPHPLDLQLLLRVWQRAPREELLKIVTFSLDKMAAGGIYDHLGGGFHRYSVDERWLVPHFEKMLYDNALLAACYTEAYQATGNEDYQRVARETLDYVLREMTGPGGGFYSTQDADSEGEEGKFYVWTPREIAEVLGADRAQAFCYVYDVTEAGNFEGHNILNLPKTITQCAALLHRDEKELRAALAEDRAKLLAVRSHRIPPGLDDKVLVSWNGLMIDALAKAGAAFGEARYTAAALQAAEFILAEMRRPDGRLLHSWRLKQAKFDAYQDDYAALGNALVSLYEATFDERWIDKAAWCADTLLEQFVDQDGGGFFFTAADHEQLITRQKDVQDSSVPSGNALAAMLLVRLGKLTGEAKYLEAMEGTLAFGAGLMHRAPTAAGQLLIALDLHLGPTPELVLLGAADSLDMQTVTADLRRRFWPRKVVARRPAANESKRLAPLFEGRKSSGPPTLYVCENFTCREPVIGRDAILATWKATAVGKDAK